MTRFKRFVTISLAILPLGWLSGPARSAVVELRHAVSQDSSLIHHYTFEGLSVPGRQEDKAGTANLIAQAMASGGNTANISYGLGYDAFTTAMTPESINANSGAALWTSSAIALPATFTVEALVAPQSPGTGLTAYAVASRANSSSNDRGYFIAENDSGDTLYTRVGAGSAQNTLNPFAAGHWYYVANTYSVSGGTTTINSYVADLTSGGPLLHPVVNYVDPGNYGTSVPLAIGSLPQGQYPFAGAIDEVALYGSVLDERTITQHFGLINADAVVYREIFPSDTQTTRALSAEGWNANWGANAAPTTAALVQQFNTAFDADVAAVNSDPHDTGATMGYLNNYSGSTTTEGFIYWTEEFGPLDAGSVSAIGFDTRFSSSYVAQVALRIDDQWYLSADFDNPTGTSTFAGSSVWESQLLDFSTAEWTTLTFVEGSTLAVGTTEVTLPNGAITAFGMFQQDFTYSLNARFDNFTIRAVPEPGSWLLMAFAGLGAMLMRRRRRG